VNRDLLWVRYLAECLERIDRCTTDGEEAFLADSKAQDAVLRNLQVIAETAQRLSGGLREQYREMEWEALRSLRNLIVHESLNVSMEHVWEVVACDIPALRRAVEEMLAEISR
jgi:uncharacterized protein with HEPN domain